MNKRILETELNEKGDYYYNIEDEGIIQQLGPNYESGCGPTLYIRSTISLGATKDELADFFKNEINANYLLSIVLNNR